MIRIFLPRFLGIEKNHSADENTVGGHIARGGTWTKPSSGIPSRSNSPGYHPQWVPAPPGSPPPSSLLHPPSTALHLRRHSNLFSAAGWHALRPNSLSQDALPYIFPSRYSTLPSLPLLDSPLSGRSRYLILFPYIFIFFLRLNISPFTAANLYSGPHEMFAFSARRAEP
jgi:hypothetical protein